MRRMNVAVMMVLVGVVCLPDAASAQILVQRCANDSRNAAQATARVEWMRRCALLKAPPSSYDTGIPSSTGGTLLEYVEAGAANNFWGMNMYSPQSYDYDINSSYIFALYLSGMYSQSLDADGFYKWVGTAARKKSRPFYPIYGNSPDINSNQQLFPHPTLANCNFYLDKNGTQPASGAFYLNAFCESSSL